MERNFLFGGVLTDSRRWVGAVYCVACVPAMLCVCLVHENISWLPPGGDRPLAHSVDAQPESASKTSTRDVPSLQAHRSRSACREAPARVSGFGRDVRRGKSRSRRRSHLTEEPRDEKVLLVVRVTRQKVWVVVGQPDVVNTERAVGRQHREHLGEEDGGITPRKDEAAAVEEHQIAGLHLVELCDGVVVLQPGTHDSIAQRVDFRVVGSDRWK